jgi:hypothetical protein
MAKVGCIRQSAGKEGVGGAYLGVFLAYPVSRYAFFLRIRESSSTKDCVNVNS